MCLVHTNTLNLNALEKLNEDEILLVELTQLIQIRFIHFLNYKIGSTPTKWTVSVDFSI